MADLTVKDVIKHVEELAPKNLAFDGDPIGLHVGSMNQKVSKVMVTLDALEDVVDEAVENNVDLIIAHHPLLFKPLKSINLNTEKGRIIAKLIKNDISVYAAHTNLDIATDGVNDMLMDQLGLDIQGVVVETEKESLVKLVVYVPSSHQDEVRNAISEAGAGHIGDYSHCTFNTLGEGTFKPLEGTNPHIGEQNQLEKVEEYRMETIMPANIITEVVSAAKAAHPYEEMAYDLYPLELTGASKGLGRIGKLREPMNLDDFSSYCKTAFGIAAIRFVGDADKQISTVAMIGGSGGKFINQAKISGADVLITGDIDYHTAHDAKGLGLTMIDPGHHIEQVMKTALTRILENKINSEEKVIDIIVSTINTDPFSFI
ncbi:Nif3-like dinuclear metal center hexameric protein [Halalkalibacillus halophilus]|uniref:Nif3-like dinuclear metal center hexameric protein n=1 Tax=Halalkalibacillus halophilus TaxID=392827 RepID=UPI0003F54D51|nr:Nif3-like dinuclear metal center hexameric protein [Halalkalibacillus halophilus]